MGASKTTATEVGRDAADRVRESVATNELAQRARDAMYTIVGLGVMGAQRATAAGKQASRKLQKDDVTVAVDVDAIKAKTKDATVVAKRQFSKFDEVLAGALARIEEAMSPLEDRLPPTAKDTVEKVRVASKGLHAQLQAQLASPAEPTEAPKPKKRAATAATAADTDGDDAAG